MKNCGIKTQVASVSAGQTKLRNKVQGQASTIHPTCDLLNAIIFFLILDIGKQTHIGKWHFLTLLLPGG